MFEFSPSEKEFVRVALTNGLRADGRGPTQRRAAQVKCQVLDNLAGSAFISIDYGKCEIYTGVKLKISEVGEGQIPTNQVFLELSAMRKLNKEQNNVLIYLQQLLQLHFINKEKDNFKLLAISGSKKHYIQIHIETFILSQPHLSLLQPLYLCIRKALESALIPKLECFFNEVTQQETVELTNETQSIKLDGVDSLMLVGCWEGKYILDLTPLQFESVESVLFVGVKDQKVRTLQSVKGAISTEDIHKVCRFAIQNSK